MASEPNIYRTLDGKQWWIEYEGNELGPFGSADDALLALAEKQQEEADNLRELKEGK